jgi:hypothetical protein
MSALDIKYWEIILAGTQIVAHWFDPVTGASIQAPIVIAPDGSLKVRMPKIDLEDIR